jgi:hypothetical protein
MTAAPVFGNVMVPLWAIVFVLCALCVRLMLALIVDFVEWLGRKGE